MNTQNKTLALLGLSRPRRPAVWIVVALAMGLGLKFGYDFGDEIGGVLLGLVAAINGAVFCAILAGSVVDRMFPERPVDRTQK